MTKHEKKPGNPWFYWLRVCHSACHFAYIAKWQNDKLTNCHCCLFTCKECRNHFCDFTQSHRVTKSQTRKTLINQDFLHVKTALWFCDSAFCKSSSHILYNFRRLRNATSRINTAFFVTYKQITPHRIWYNRVD